MVHFPQYLHHGRVLRKLSVERHMILVWRFMSSFDRSKPPKEVSLREAHEKAVQRSLVVYNASVVGVGSMRKKYEGLL